MKFIWRALKWFFNVSDENNKMITRKTKHGMRPAAVPAGEVITIKDECHVNHTSFEEVYRNLVKLAQHEDRHATDAIESAKQELWVPYGIHEKQIEHIINLCGFQKTEIRDGELHYDKRLIHLVNLSMNIYGGESAEAIEQIVSKVSKPTFQADRP